MAAKIIRVVVLSALVAASLQLMMTHSFASHSDPKPLTTTTWYQDSVSTSLMDSKGCNTADSIENGQLPSNGLIVMLYGAPVEFADGSWGATAFGSPDRKTGEIRDAMKAWGAGFHRCLSSSIRSGVLYRLAVATSNQFNASWSNTKIGNHATQWANMVKNIHDHFVSQGWSADVAAYGGSDMELAWAGPNATKAWANAYDGVTGRRLYYNVGDAAGCQTFSSGGPSSCGSGSFTGWDSADVFDISYGIFSALPLPQIYTTSGSQAEQWVMISKWSLDNGGPKIGFGAVLSQEQACNQQGGCSGIDNTPGQSWNQMRTKMDAKPATITDMTYSTDVKWQNP